MAAQHSPVPESQGLLTPSEWAALPRDEHMGTELQERILFG